MDTHNTAPLSEILRGDAPEGAVPPEITVHDLGASALRGNTEAGPETPQVVGIHDPARVAVVLRGQDVLVNTGQNREVYFRPIRDDLTPPGVSSEHK